MWQETQKERVQCFFTQLPKVHSKQKGCIKLCMTLGLVNILWS